jgi:hypothetical protein
VWVIGDARYDNTSDVGQNYFKIWDEIGLLGTWSITWMLKMWAGCM